MTAQAQTPEMTNDPAGPDSFTGTARSEFDSLASTTKQEASRLSSSLQSEFDKFLAHQQAGFAAAVRDFAKSLRNSNSGNGAGSTHSASSFAAPVAEVLEGSAERIERADPSQVLNDIRRVAREQPVAMAVGAAALGLLVSRFAKSSNR